MPDAAPRNVDGYNKSSESIEVTWENVIGKDRNGIITGYKVYYKAVEEFALNKTEEVEVVNNGIAVKQVLVSLEKYISYNITVLAFTSKGDGPRSTAIIVRTDQDGKCNEH